MKQNVATLLIRCPDQPGIIGSTTSFLHLHGANITSLDQHATDPEGGVFFMRMEFQTPQLDLPHSALVQSFDEVIAQKFDMDYRIAYGDQRPKTAIFVSKHDHALLELLWRWQRDQLPTDIPMVISNHDDLRKPVESFGIPFHHVPNTPDTKEEAEAQIRDLLGDDVDLIVLARYMQILSPEFVADYTNRIINIHHSFLPAFVGADPYRQAYQKGVKLVGATAHYVTAQLDAGPIIEQEVARVSHRQSVEELKEIGRSVERQALARAVIWHLENRVIIDGNKTIVFAGRSQ
jgi:formyltetrahydrofolate deformylase